MYSFSEIVKRSLREEGDKDFLLNKLDMLEKWFWSLFYINPENSRYYINAFSLQELEQKIKWFMAIVKEYNDILQRFLKAQKVKIKSEDEEYYRKFKDKWKEFVQKIETAGKKSYFCNFYDTYLLPLPDSLK